MNFNSSENAPLLSAHTLAPFLTSQGVAVENVDFTGCAGLSGHIVTHKRTEFTTPALDHHLLEVAIEGKHKGTAAADGMVTSSSYASTPGAVSFRPALRPNEFDLVGQGRYLHLLVSLDWMDQAKYEMLRGDPDKVDLLGFNTLSNSELQKLMSSLVTGRPTTRNQLETDILALELSREIVRNYTTGHLVEDEKVPRLSSAQLIRSMDLIESCISLKAGLDSIAEALGLPLVYFLRAFEEATDLRPNDFLRERQIDRAGEWLNVVNVDTPEERAFLADACGFKSYEMLDAAFKQQRKVSITEYVMSKL